MYVLYAEAVAAAQDGAGVVGLEDVFEHYANMSCTVEDKAVEELPFVVAEELCGGLVELLFLFEGELGEQLGVGFFYFGHCY